MFSPNARPPHGPIPHGTPGPGPGMNNHPQHHMNHNPNIHHPGQGQGGPPPQFYNPNMTPQHTPHRMSTPLPLTHFLFDTFVRRKRADEIVQSNMQFPPPSQFQMSGPLGPGPQGGGTPHGHGHGNGVFEGQAQGQGNGPSPGPGQGQGR